jgi:hypothetical protein
MPNLLHWGPRESIRAGCLPTNSPGPPRQPDLDWPRCSTTPRPATPWLSMRSTDSAARSRKSPERSSISASVESRCVPYEKGWNLHTDRTGGGSDHGYSRRTGTRAGPRAARRIRESRRARSLPVTKPPKLSPDRQVQVRRLAATGEPVRELAAAFRIGRATAYRYLAGESPTDSCHEGWARSVP